MTAPDFPQCSSQEREEAERFFMAFHFLMQKIDAVDAKPKEFGTGMKLHRSEIHGVQAIGALSGRNMMALADHLQVTKGAVSQLVSKLVKKGLVRKVRREDNAKEVLLELTDLGWTAYHKHEEFHALMARMVKAHYGDEVLEKTRQARIVLEDLLAMAELYEDQTLDF
ncbi:MarR family winged helix-turn-helix transcriptional regulator [Rhodovibrionaceae bacterium A322]